MSPDEFRILITKFEHGNLSKERAREVVQYIDQAKLGAKKLMMMWLTRFPHSDHTFGNLENQDMLRIMNNCWHCNRPHGEHADFRIHAKCLFEPTYYEPAGQERVEKLYEMVLAVPNGYGVKGIR